MGFDDNECLVCYIKENENNSCDKENSENICLLCLGKVFGDGTYCERVTNCLSDISYDTCSLCSENKMCFIRVTICKPCCNSIESDESDESDKSE